MSDNRVIKITPSYKSPLFHQPFGEPSIRRKPREIWDRLNPTTSSFYQLNHSRRSGGSLS